MTRPVWTSFQHELLNVCLRVWAMGECPCVCVTEILQYKVQWETNESLWGVSRELQLTLEVGKLKVVVVQGQVVLHGREAAWSGGEISDTFVLTVQHLSEVICNKTDGNQISSKTLRGCFLCWPVGFFFKVRVVLPPSPITVNNLKKHLCKCCTRNWLSVAFFGFMFMIINDIYIN